MDVYYLIGYFLDAFVTTFIVSQLIRFIIGKFRLIPGSTVKNTIAVIIVPLVNVVTAPYLVQLLVNILVAVISFLIYHLRDNRHVPHLKAETV